MDEDNDDEDFDEHDKDDEAGIMSILMTMMMRGMATMMRVVSISLRYGGQYGDLSAHSLGK